MKKIYLTITLIIIAVILFSLKNIILYKAAVQYCKTKDLRSAYEGVICQDVFISKFDENLALKYIKVRDNCFLESANQYETGICTDKKMMQLR